MTRFITLTTSEYRNYGDTTFEEGRIARELAQVARQQKENNDDGNVSGILLGSIHSDSTGRTGRDDVRRVSEVVGKIMDYEIDESLFLSLWIKKHEGRAAWLNWLWFQIEEPADDEQERGEIVTKWFDELEVG